MTGPVLAVGGKIRWEGHAWTVAALAGAQARLVDDAGSVVTVLVSHLFTDPGLEVIGSSRRAQAPPFARLATLPEGVREQALAWERHIREVEEGVCGPGGVARPQYDPAVNTVAQREAAKVRELRAAGQAVSVSTVRRMRVRYREGACGGWWISAGPGRSLLWAGPIRGLSL